MIKNSRVGLMLLTLLSASTIFVAGARAEDEDTDGLVAHMIERMQKTGAPVSGWEQRGVDMEKRLNDTPGGTTGNILFSKGEDADSLSGPAMPGPMALPKQWQVVAGTRTGTAIQGRQSTAVFSMRNGYYIVVADNARRIGNAICASGRGTAALYRDTRLSTDREAETMARSLQRVVIALRQRETCTIYVETKGGHFRAQLYTPDGRPFTKLNAEADNETIRRLEPLDAMFAAN